MTAAIFIDLAVIKGRAYDSMTLPQSDSLSSLSRRDIAKRSAQTLLSLSLLEHLCQGNLLAQEAKLTAVKWLTEINRIGMDLKGGKLEEIVWQTEVEKLMGEKIEMGDLLKFIDFENIAKKAKLPDNGAQSIRVQYPEIEGVPGKLVFGEQIFAMKKGRSVVPHAHNNMATAFIVLKGEFRGRHYDRIEDQREHMIIKPTIDKTFGPGDTSSVSDDKDNIHWFKSRDEAAFIFNLHLLDVNPNNPKQTGRIYLDPAGEALDDGLVRARLIDSKEAHLLYG